MSRQFRDPAYTEVMIAWLQANDYDSITEWAESGDDFYYEPESGEWYSHHHPPGWPGAPPVDIFAELSKVIDAEG